MADINELEHRLTVLRGELVAMSRDGCTPTQFLKLQRDLVSAWAAVEDYKCRNMPARPSVADRKSRAGTRGETTPQGGGSSPS